MPCRTWRSIAGRLHLPRTAVQQELQRLEGELSDMDISLYRWWAWANHYRVRSQVRGFVAQSLGLGSRNVDLRSLRR